MSVLLMQLAGPLQSWGASSRFSRRSTEAAPTKSGVIGLLAAAQGRQRTDDFADLAALRFGVRTDQRGVLLRDFQTAHHFATGDAQPISERYYLADAVFVAGVEGDAGLIDDLDTALRRPEFLPYLGRRSCPPARPIELRVEREHSLEQALRDIPWQAAAWHQRRRRHEPHIRLEILIEATPAAGGGDSVRDQPLSFNPLHRRYALRGVRRIPVSVPNPAARTDHDPTSLLEGA